MKTFYMNSTHWDREWYVPFQSFRYNLVETVNRLLDILESDENYKIYCLDGQTVVLEDYAEAEPLRAEKLKEYIKSGRIKVGPWYVSPDEFLVSGESLIRNLAKGEKLSKEWGSEPLKYGYVNDIFGHIAQLPQIFSGFDIHGAYLGRGVGNPEFSHCKWQSPDGTVCFTTVGSYPVFYRKTAAKYGEDNFYELLKDFCERFRGRGGVPIFFISNTDDHSMPTDYTPEIFELIKKMYPEDEFVDAPPTEMVKELEKYADILPCVYGELTAPTKEQGGRTTNLKLIYNTLSSYYPIKAENDRCQDILESRIEPMLAAAKLYGKGLNHRYVELAYKYLLQNHPHDSICGCSGDQVHKDMIYRFDQVREIADKLYEEIRLQKPDMVTAEGSGSEYELTVSNFTGHKAEKVITAEIDFYKGFKTAVGGYAGKERHNNFVIRGENGAEIPYQIINIARNISKRVPGAGQTEAVYDVYTVNFFATLPAFGYAVYKVLPEEKKTVYTEKLAFGTDYAENKFVSLKISPFGQLTVTDKRNGRVYSGLNEYVDSGEVGDGWFHESPMNNEDVLGLGTPAEISILSAGAFSVSFKIVKKLNVPKYLDGQTFTRSEEKTELAIVNTVTLTADSPAVTVSAEIDNTAKDHRLSVLFPTRTEGEKYFSGQAFCYVERNTGWDTSTADWAEQDSMLKNTNGIVGKVDENGRGLGIVSAYGIHEAGVDNDRDATLSVTLFRSFDRVFLQTKAVNSQLLQKMRFKYAIVPIERFDYTELLYIRHYLANTEVTFSRRVSDGTANAGQQNFFSLSNSRIAVSVFKQAEDNEGVVLRLYNPNATAESTELRLDFGFSDVSLNSLGEMFTAPLTADGNTVSLSFKPFEIKTVRVKP